MPNARFWERRRELNLTMHQLGKLTGLRPPEISQVEKDGWIPPPEIRARLAEALKTSVEDLFPVAEPLAVPAHAEKTS